MNNLGTLNRALVEAVEVRMELDLRIGAAFTRMLTKRLKSFQELSEKVISYGMFAFSSVSLAKADSLAPLVQGSCQFPTLGFIVDQYRRVQEFDPESFWKLELVLRKEGKSVYFHWARNHLFDQRVCAILYEKCMENPVALVTGVVSKPTFK
jgi:DNA topoisomerase-3